MARSGLDHHAGSGQQSQALHFAQSGGITIRHAADDGGDSAGPLGERDFGALGHGSVFFGDDVAVGIDFRVA